MRCEEAPALSIPQVVLQFSRTIIRSRQNSNATAKLAALMPFGKVADFLSELLPLLAKAGPGTIRDRTMRVGRRLHKSAEYLAVSARCEPCEPAVVGFDGGYMRSRHRRLDYNFEVVAGKVLGQEGNATRFAFVRDGGSSGESASILAIRRSGVNKSNSVTVLTDGDAGKRAIQATRRAESRT